MDLLIYMIISMIVLGLGYRFMGRFLARFFRLDRNVITPARQFTDGMDFVPAAKSYLLPQHFSAIAAAGPIVGPILAGMYFGWLPTWLWILVGAIFVGGVHDFTTLLASVRHRGKSIAEVVKQYMNQRSYILFMIFIWISLVYVIIAFADVTAGTFIQAASTADAAAPGPGVATSSMLYLILAVLMGLSIRLFKISANKAKLFFLPMVFLAIWIGPHMPFSIQSLIATDRPQLIWDYLLLGYCFLAALAPMWLLMQPRGDLGGYFLYIVMAVGIVGIIVGALSGQIGIAGQALSGQGNFLHSAGGLPPLFPLLFITVACGACSGFHSIVASGTSSKQLEYETDARPVGYGGMLLEGFLATLSLATVMMLAPKGIAKPAVVYADGIGALANQATFKFISIETARQFGLLCFATFVFDTLDACTRLSRYVLMELTGWKTRKGMALATALTLLFPVIVLSMPPVMVDGKSMSVWQVFWTLFGSSNQLLAALALLGVSMWLLKTARSLWFTLIPSVFMQLMTLWSLLLMVVNYIKRLQSGSAMAGLQHVEFGVALILIGLAMWLVVEALIIFRQYRQLNAM